MGKQENLLSAADALQDQLVAWRRDFHAHPELGLEEHRSAAVIAERLGELGYGVTSGVAATGVVAVLKGKAAGPVVMLRFDMDALPIAEEKAEVECQCQQDKKGEVDLFRVLSHNPSEVPVVRVDGSPVSRSNPARSL